MTHIGLSNAMRKPEPKAEHDLLIYEGQAYFHNLSKKVQDLIIKENLSLELKGWTQGDDCGIDHCALIDENGDVFETDLDLENDCLEVLWWI